MGLFVIPSCSEAVRDVEELLLITSFSDSMSTIVFPSSSTVIISDWFDEQEKDINNKEAMNIIVVICPNVFNILPSLSNIIISCSFCK